jgi:AcrR family transcriptional regulator
LYSKQERKMREKIIDTAIEEFTKNGLKFTMNDVAKALGISKKTIYTVFESKQEVLVAIADRYAGDFTEMREEIERDGSLDTLEKLERLFCALPTKYYNIGLSRIFELAQKYPKQYKYLMEAVNQGWTLAEQYLEKGIREGKIRKDISKPVVMAMIRGTVTCFLESDILYKNGLTYEQGKEEMVQIIMKGIRKA